MISRSRYSCSRSSKARLKKASRVFAIGRMKKEQRVYISHTRIENHERIGITQRPRRGRRVAGIVPVMCYSALSSRSVSQASKTVGGLTVGLTRLLRCKYTRVLLRAWHREARRHEVTSGWLTRPCAQPRSHNAATVRTLTRRAVRRLARNVQCPCFDRLDFSR